MKYLNYITAGALMLTAASVCATEPASELTRAMFKAYEQTLQEDPTDNITLYRRAVEYYRIGMYDHAFDDLTKAIKYTDSKDTDLLTHEYSLAADIFIQKENYAEALANIDKALTINPKSYADIYKKGNIYLLLKDGGNAYRTFKSMLSLKSRSQEAFFGMAKASILSGKKEDAAALIDEMKSVDSTSALTFNRIAELYLDMGEYEKSVVNYLTALSLGNDIQRPVDALREIAEDDYGAFCRGFDFAQSQGGAAASSLAYVRAMITANCNHNEDAFEIMKGIYTANPDVSASFLATMAQTAMAIGKGDEAKKYADEAVTVSPSSGTYLVKSAVELNTGNPATALLFANKAYQPAEPDVQSLLAIAKAAVAMGDSKAAVNALNEAVLLDAEALDALLLRSYVKQYMLNDKAGADSDLQRAASAVDISNSKDMAYKAIAETLSGKLLDGEGTIKKMLERDPSAEALAYAAMYYAQTGDMERCEEYRAKATGAGYDNIFFLEQDATPYMSLSTKK